MRLLTIALITLTGFCLAAGCLAAEPNGILKIEGQYVKHIILHHEGKEVLREPNEVMELPAGAYTVFEVKLQGDYVSHPYNLPAKKIDIRQGETTVLKMGAPLNHNVDVKRQGDSLVLNYKLQGIGGETYSPEYDKKAPQLAVYKGDEQICSGAFKYG